MEPDEEELDPRIEIELESLNTASSQINQYENQLEKARRNCQRLNVEITRKLKHMRNKLGESTLNQTVPYFIQIELRKQALRQTQEAAVRYDRACSLFQLAKEMVANTEMKAEQTEGPLDSALQEMLNHAIMKLNEAQVEMSESQFAHSRATEEFQRLEELIKKLEKEHKNDIRKAKPYFETKKRYTEIIKEEEDRVLAYEEKVTICKKLYQETLQALDNISQEIHQSRDEARVRKDLGERGCGVGEEAPSSDSLHSITSRLSLQEDRYMHRPRRRTSLHPEAMPIIFRLQKALQDQVREVGDLKLVSRGPSLSLDSRSISDSARSSDTDSLAVSCDFAMDTVSTTVMDVPTSSSSAC